MDEGNGMVESSALEPNGRAVGCKECDVDGSRGDANGKECCSMLKDELVCD